MKRQPGPFLIGVILILSLTGNAFAARVRVHRGPAGRVHVTVARGFPLHRAFPEVVVRGGVVRVAPRTYLAPVVFGAVVVASLPAEPHRVWRGAETLEREDGWTDFSLDVDRRGGHLFLQIDRGSAQISFAEVVFDNGDAQVIDFNDHVHRSGLYNLLDFKDGRKVDHVRIVAKADSPTTEIAVHLTN